ncbi:MAG: hypothetical protein ABSC08_10410, partial [Bryobacteraceae bacterium]
LVEADGEDREADAWKAVFWYASAHEDTVCELSSAAKAKELGAEDHGPDVWISRGKHASFLSQSACRGGCGGDVCEGSQSFHPTKIVNIGERGAWLNGCSWVASGKWRMLQKMGTDFTDDRIALLGKNEPGGVVTLNPQLRRTQAVLSAGDSTVEAVGISGRKTGLALAEAGTETDSALQAAGEAAGEAGRATDRALAGSTTKTGDALSAAGSSTIHALAVSARSAAKALRTAVRSTSSFLGIGRN